MERLENDIAERISNEDYTPELRYQVNLEIFDHSDSLTGNDIVSMQIFTCYAYNGLSFEIDNPFYKIWQQIKQMNDDIDIVVVRHGKSRMIDIIISLKKILDNIA